jgi:hypothetical protein
MRPQSVRKAHKDHIKALAERRTSRRIVDNIEKSGEKYPDLKEQLDQEFAEISEARKAKEARREAARKANEKKETK